MDNGMKKAYREKTEAQLREWGARIEGLRNKAAQLGADAKIGALEKIEELKKKVSEGTESLRELDTAGDADWEKLRSKLEGIAGGVKKGIEDITARFK